MSPQPAARSSPPRSSFLFAGAGPEARVLVSARALRGFADGFVSILLVTYLQSRGFSEVRIGALVTATLLGSAALTLAVGLLGQRLPPRRVLFGATALMMVTGLGFASVTAFWPLLLVAFAGTLNPSSGDVSVFLPTEQALLSAQAGPLQRTALFARYNLGGAFAGALGALASALPALLAHRFEWQLEWLQRLGFLGYALVAVAIAALYINLRPAPEAPVPGLRWGLGPSRPVVLRLAALFSLDSFGSGLVVQSLLVLWLFKRFDLDESAAAAIFFAAGLLAAFSQFASPWLAARIGLVRTMVFTHLPASAFLILAAFMPTAPLAVSLLLARMAFSQMHAPARQAFVMQAVRPAERAAAASVTNVPRSLASAFSPLIAGLFLNATSFGWSLVAAGLLKIAYDLLLLLQFGAHAEALPASVAPPP